MGTREDGGVADPIEDPRTRTQEQRVRAPSLTLARLVAATPSAVEAVAVAEPADAQPERGEWWGHVGAAAEDVGLEWCVQRPPRERERVRTRAQRERETPIASELAASAPEHDGEELPPGVDEEGLAEGVDAKEEVEVPVTPPARLQPHERARRRPRAVREQAADGCPAERTGG